jgi:hypothetical protein
MPINNGLTNSNRTLYHSLYGDCIPFLESGWRLFPLPALPLP